MNWGSVDAFLAMGGYGLYVWGSYGITLALLAIEILLVRKRRRDAIRMLRSAQTPRGAEA
jgi:heme exporter protein D